MKRILSTIVFLIGSLTGVLRAQAIIEIPEIRDDPKAREEYEFNLLQDPVTKTIPPLMRQKELSFAATLPDKEAIALRKRMNGMLPDLVPPISWSSRGPYNIGGRTRALGIDIANENIILAGGVSGSMWRTTDGGSTWVNTTNPASLHTSTCLVQDTRPGHRNTWYYGTGEINGNSAAGSGGSPYRGDGLFKSTDDGLSWSLLPATATSVPQTFDHGFDYVWNVAIDPSNLSESVVYAATFGAIMRSSDGGATWSTVLGSFSNTENNGTTYSYYSDVAVTSTGIVYATLSTVNSAGTTSPWAGFYRSTDGIHWTNITPIGVPSVVARTVMAIVPENENDVWFLANTPGAGKLDHYLWLYTYLSGNGSDLGGNWDIRTSAIPSFGPPVGNFSSQDSYDLLVKVKPDDSNFVYIGGTNLYRSSDAFTSPSNVAWIGGYAPANDVSQYPNQHPDQHALVFLPSDPMTMFSGTDGGLSKTTNDTVVNLAWTALNNGYVTGQFYSIAIDHATSGHNAVIGGLQDNGSWFANSPLSSALWKRKLSGDGATTAVADGHSSYYMSSQFGVTYRLVLDALGNITTFTRVDPTRPGGSASYMFVNPYILDPANTDRMYLAGGDRVWRNSSLSGIPLLSNSTTSVNWSVLSNTASPGSAVTALAASTVPPNRLYYGRSNGQVYRVDSAAVGDPAAVNVTGGSFPVGGFVSSIAVDPGDANNVLVAFSNYNVVSLFSSTDGGSNWTAVAGNLEQFPDGSGNGPSIRSVIIAPPGGYFVGTSTGVYSTKTLNGASTVWQQEGSSVIGNQVVPSLDARSVDGLVVAGTHGAGVFSGHFPVGAPAAPILVFPADSAENVLPPTSLSWDPPYGAARYHVQLSPDSDFATLMIDDSTVVDTARLAGTLAPTSSYFWRVRAFNEFGWSPFSEIRTFETGSLILGGVPVRQGWSLSSVPLITPDPRASVLFPTKSSGPFVYDGGYQLRDTVNPGQGAWLRYDAEGVVNILGFPMSQESVAVVTGWNLIGSITAPIPVSAVGTSLPGLVSSYFFGYQGNYVIVDSILPGRGYWVKANQAGTIILGPSAVAVPAKNSQGSELAAFARLIVSDARGRSQTLWFGSHPSGVRMEKYEMPPLSPSGEFDARFASNRMLEIAEGSAAERFPLTISGASYPLRISWSGIGSLKAALRIGRNEVPMEGSSSLEVSDAEASIALRIAGNGERPAQFALEQNFPNPFNPSTEIRYALTREATVTLRIFNVLGQLVTKLAANDVQEEGYHAITWNAAGAPSGLYYYRLDAVATDDPGFTFTQVKKMLLVK